MSDLNQQRLCRAEFSCEAPNASSVFLIGSFNDWNLRATPMTCSGGGEWRAVLELPPGQHQYQFVVVYHGQINIRDDGPYGTMSHVAAPLRPVAALAV